MRPSMMCPREREHPKRSASSRYSSLSPGSDAPFPGTCLSKKSVDVDPGGGADSVDDDEKVDFSTRSWAIVERKAESVYWSHYDTRCNKEKRIEAKKIPRRFA